MEIFKQTTDIPHYDAMLKNPDYFREEKGLTFHVEYISPDAYMQKIAEMHGVPVEREWEHVDKGSVEYLLRRVREGNKLAMPVIDYTQKLQEGRNRMAVAKKLGIKRVPVMIIEKEKHPSSKTEVLYKCPRCGRVVRKPPGLYYCKVCGSKYVMRRVG
ncbi:hypothetical protein DRO59_00720 [Candidatus Bathyarchaeota archaeon]|nr:MAG: hypothetical protein DRO59_00720 [Candidatus Bathyarchaeota archaeon]